MEVDGKTAATVAATGAGIIATIMVGLTRLLYKAIGHRIAGAEQMAKEAQATAIAVDSRRREDTIALHEKLDAQGKVLSDLSSDIAYIRGRMEA